MIDSHLKKFVDLRLSCLKEVDQAYLSESQAKELALRADHSPSLKKNLKRGKGSSPRILAEVKKKSPSLGSLSDRTALEICSQYVDAGVAAISVLVDEINFSGHPKDLHDCCLKYPHIPFLYKDFVVCPYQVYLAKAIGASAILLMAQLLEKHEMETLFHLSLELGLEPFLEVHEWSELERVAPLRPPILGINARNFKDSQLPVDLATAPRLLQKHINVYGVWPEGTALVAQSGIFSESDFLNLCDACPEYLPDAIQIGSSLSKTSVMPAWLLSILREAAH